MNWIFSGLDLFLLGWLFWPIVFILLVICYNITKDAGKFYSRPLVYLSLILMFSAYRWTAVRHIFTDWKNLLLFITLYIVSGFVVSIWKWLIILLDFKENAPIHILSIRTNEIRKDGTVPEDDYVSDRLCTMLSLPYGAIVTDEGSFYLKPSKFPIATWWTYWPFFFLSVLFDPIQRLVNRLVEWSRQIYTKISQSFKVKG